MAKYDDKNKKVPIKYTSRDFNSIKQDLINHARRYYPDTYKDFNDASFGSLVMDQVAYTGDILSFYLDYQANESFLDTANEYDNVVKLTRQMGYKYRGKASSHGYVSFFILIPADSSAFVVLLYVRSESPPNDPPSLNCICVLDPPGVPPPPPASEITVLAILPTYANARANAGILAALKSWTNKTPL